MFDAVKAEARLQKLHEDIKKREKQVEDLQSEIRDERVEINDALNLVHHWEAEVRSLRNAAQHTLPRHGVDIAWGNPPIAALKRQGISFVVRYYSPDKTKNLTRAEAEDYSHAGLDVVTVWESTAQAALAGYDQGVYDAKQALLESEAVGQPAHTPIYFAVDFPLEAGQDENVAGYFKGCADVLTRGRVGAYGGLAAVKLAHERQLCGYLWQTLAWSNGVWLPAAHLRQIRNGVKVAGVDCDLDLAISANFGQWRV